jgi:SAM-dependent methyltransferase
MGGNTISTLKPGYKRLWNHSYRLGFNWLLRTARHGWPGRKAGFLRLLVPLDPWRYYEMGTLADQTYGGRCLDVSSPKLLPSLLDREGNGDWLGIDLFDAEIDAWRVIDPKLELEVQDATAMPYDDSSFDNALCVSVIEHVGRDKDTVALAEILRVVKPGGTLHLTTMVAAASRDVFVEHKIYGNASEEAADGRVFFEHVYSPAEVDRMTADAGWRTVHREFAVQTRIEIQQRFHRWTPLSYLAGPLLRLWYPRTIETTTDPSVIDAIGQEDAAVTYVRLVKP